jgi:hypothetical protein
LWKKDTFANVSIGKSQLGGKDRFSLPPIPTLIQILLEMRQRLQVPSVSPAQSAEQPVMSVSSEAKVPMLPAVQGSAPASACASGRRIRD